MTKHGFWVCDVSSHVDSATLFSPVGAGPSLICTRNRVVPVAEMFETLSSAKSVTVPLVIFASWHCVPQAPLVDSALLLEAP
jgi:hypothetical protein